MIHWYGTTNRQLIANTDSRGFEGRLELKSQGVRNDADEMQLFMHLKRKGASATKNKKAYTRHGKHKGRGYDY